MTKWTRVDYGCHENPGVFDTGNGALRFIDENRDYPGIERVTVEPYAAGRGNGCVYYRSVANPDRTYATLRQAVEGEQ